MTGAYTLALGAAYGKAHPGVSVDVSAQGKDGGLLQLAAGSADLVNAAMALADQDRPDVVAALKEAEARGVVFSEVASAVDPVIFCVNPANPVRRLTFQQLRDIYAGRIVNWREVGGPDQAITVWVSDYNQDHKMHVVSRDLLAGLPRATGAKLDANGKGMLEQVSNDVTAIGYDSRFYCLANQKGNPAKKFVMLEIGPADAPLPESPSRKYPVARHVWAIYRSSDISSEARSFLDFTLSPEGQRIIASCDVLPLNAPLKTLEVARWSGNRYEPLLRVAEDLVRNARFRFAGAAAGTFYVRNNTRYDGLAPTLVGADGKAKTLTVAGTLQDPSFKEVRFPAGEVTEIRLPDLAAGDVLRFTLNGHTVALDLDGNSSGGGCNGGFGALAAVALWPLVVLRRRG